MIHPTALVHPKAKLASNVRVGPYAVIEAGVELGPDCVIGPHAYLTGLTTIGARNRFFAGCVVGEAPQDLKYKGEPTRLRMGDDNTIREYVTVHRSATTDEDTVVGSHNLLMAHCHVAHNCQLGNHIIVANGALLGGHANVADRAVVSGNCLVHQFVRIGTLAMMQGGSAISKDLPPFTMARGDNGICGLNVIGLRRSGMSAADRLQLKRLYRALFRDNQNVGDAVETARARFTSPCCRVMLDFVAASKRGVCADVGRRAEPDDEEG